MRSRKVFALAICSSSRTRSGRNRRMPIAQLVRWPMTAASARSNSASTVDSSIWPDVDFDRFGGGALCEDEPLLFELLLSVPEHLVSMVRDLDENFPELDNGGQQQLRLRIQEKLADIDAGEIEKTLDDFQPLRLRELVHLVG